MKHIWDNVWPADGECAPYYRKYISLLNKGNIIDTLKKQRQETYTLINSLSIDEANYRYAEGKWTPKQLTGHLIDTERVFTYRALCFARNDQTKLPGFDQDEYVKQANFEERKLQSLAEEYHALRNSTILLFTSFSEDMLGRSGIASQSKLSVRSIPFITAGHERHHLDILYSKYHIKKIT